MLSAQGFYSPSPSSSKATLRSKPWLHKETDPVSLTQMLYFWKSSIPTNWRRMSSTPVVKVRGLVLGERNTLDFLLSTQRYIAQIRTPQSARTQVNSTPLLTPRKQMKKPPKDGKIRKVLSELRVMDTGKLKVIPASAGACASQPVSPRKLEWVSQSRQSRSPLGFSSDSDPSALCAQIGLLKRRGPNPGYTRLSKTAGMRRKLP